jgi:hypoxanthine phosphoribosyltransferase
MRTESELHLLLSKEKIAGAVKQLAAEIEQDYRGKNPLLLGVLKGSFVFLADLVRCLDFPVELDFIRLGSYGKGTQSGGEINLIHGLSSEVRGRHVLIVEDIVDTGLTAAFLLDYLMKRGPASLKICSLLDKPFGRQTDIKIDFSGFTVPDKFVVGYGLDWGEKYRNLPDIWFIDD